MSLNHKISTNCRSTTNQHSNWLWCHGIHESNATPFCDLFQVWARINKHKISVDSNALHILGWIQVDRWAGCKNSRYWLHSSTSQKWLAEKLRKYCHFMLCMRILQLSKLAPKTEPFSINTSQLRNCQVWILAWLWSTAWVNAYQSIN